MIYYVVVILSVFVAACSQMLLKRGAKEKYPSFWRQYVNGWVISGYVILGCTVLVNIWVMSRGVLMKEVSMMESLSYLFVPTLACGLFKESVSFIKAIWIAIIIIGLIVFFI